ncbi:hypothetical protein [Deinococcus sonorensis]|uniref:Transposase n=1 Tax=Deinococcus sonorensis TaxID=309891 RepID=A0ABV8YAV8_9DEIO
MTFAPPPSPSPSCAGVVVALPHRRWPPTRIALALLQNLLHHGQTRWVEVAKRHHVTGTATRSAAGRRSGQLRASPSS